MEGMNERNAEGTKVQKEVRKLRMKEGSMQEKGQEDKDGIEWKRK